MRNFIDIITNVPLLEGAQDYKAMIQPILSAIAPVDMERRDDPSVRLDDHVREKITKEWDAHIKAAKVTLKKEDRIVWYLRLVRQAILMNHAKIMDPVKLAKLRQEFTKRTGSENLEFIPGMLDQLEHFLSLPIQDIQTYQFGTNTFDRIIKDFKAFEKEWQDTLDRMFEDDNARVLIDFGNGWFWVDTEKAFCSKEAASMGHCGNQPRSDSDDHLLSLRKKHIINDKVYWEPFLTFILDYHGYLTEMKGRNNDKPVERYHPMIVALLRSDHVTGILGGGYLPENNFSLDDLTPVERESLLAEKPELGNSYDLFHLDGDVTKRVADRFMREMADLYGENGALDRDMDFVDDYKKTIVCSWSDVDHLLRDMNHYADFATIETIHNAANNDFDEIASWAETTNPYDAVTTLFDPKRLADDEDGDIVQDFMTRLATKLGVEEDHIVDALFHVFPKSVASIFEETKKQTVADAKRLVDTFLDNINWSLANIGFEIDNGAPQLFFDTEFLIDELHDYRLDYYEGYGIIRDALAHGWTAMNLESDDGWDSNAADKEFPTEVEDFPRKMVENFLSEILDLFETTDQLSFDF